MQEDQATRNVGCPAQFAVRIDSFFAKDVRAEGTLTAQFQNDEQAVAIVLVPGRPQAVKNDNILQMRGQCMI